MAYTESVTGSGEITVPAARRYLDDLTGLHLIDEPVRGRYRFHDLLGEYARTLAATDPAPERDAAVHRLLDYYLHTTRQAAAHFTRRTRPAGPPLQHPPNSIPDLATRDTAIGWLGTERANLHAATHYAAHHHLPAHAIELPAAMHDFLRTQGHWDQALTLHQTALHTARTTRDRHAEATALTDLGAVHYQTGDYAAAAVSLEQALGLFRDLGDRLGEANALTRLGIVQQLTGDYAAAAVSLEQALGLSRDLGDQLGEANALTNLGIVQWLTDDYAAAVSLEQALGLFRDLGDRHGEANALTKLGAVQQLNGDYAAAVSLEQALGLFRDLGDRGGEAEALNNLGCLLLASSAPAEACAHHGQALDLARAVGMPLEQARALEGIGQCHQQQGRPTEATVYLRGALALYQRLGSSDAQRVRTALADPGLSGSEE